MNPIVLTDATWINHMGQIVSFQKPLVAHLGSLTLRRKHLQTQAHSVSSCSPGPVPITYKTFQPRSHLRLMRQQAAINARDRKKPEPRLCSGKEHQCVIGLSLPSYPQCRKHVKIEAGFWR